MSLKSVPFALRASARSALHKLLLVYIVSECDEPVEEGAFIPCLTSLQRLADVGLCDTAEAHRALVELRDDKHLNYLRIYEDGGLVVEPVMPSVAMFTGPKSNG